MENATMVKQLEEHSKELSSTHLRDLLKDKERNSKMRIDSDKLLFDYSHEKLDMKAIELLEKFAQEQKLKEKFDAMFKGDKINTTEKRSVLHTALRMNKTESLLVDGVDVVKDVHLVLEQIKSFTDMIRNGTLTGFTGKKLRKFISIGIGGSYLGVDFVYNALKSHCEYQHLIKEFDLRFVANVCPIDFERATKDIDPEETLVIVISKTFTTAETMLNARNLRHWMLESLKAKGKTSLSKEDISSIISKHFCAVSTNIAKVEEFGIDKTNVFGFWDWVGGRYSVWAAVGALPLSLYFSYEIFDQFLKGAKAIDDSVKNCTDIKQNIPMMLGLLGFYNEYILQLNTRAILPYSQALCKFASHVQQLDMESNGKKVSKITNDFVKYDCGAIVFGEPGTNGQHSFYQLIHQGRAMACEFIGVAKPQFDVQFEGEAVSSHVELMCNFFAQPDALAYGKYTEDDLKGIPAELKNHKTFQGDRCSMSLLFKELTAYTTGQLLAIYEHRVACEGFIYEINSFDQWGVELGKVLAVDVRKVLSEKSPNLDALNEKYNSATLNLMKYFLTNK